jgi:glutamate synthase (NADPH/NADH) large chain
MEAYRHHLRERIAEHLEQTGSDRAAHLLDNFEDYVGKFWLVKPKAADLTSLLSRLRDTD